MQWCDLQGGDRIHHFEYGEGRIDYSGPSWILITWDDPSLPYKHHPSGLAQFLTRIEATPT
ncbi:hypothetical protein ACQPYH_28185 [Kribbella sp. CA-245084]|uniref:hypothetical protein n=1 Tax=Kribbella sp. CA-245084 TaxID=3239940 RepID=UPI003D89C248